MNKIQNRNRERGFSLAEFAVASLAFSVILLVVLAMYEVGQRSTVSGERAADLQQNTRVGFDRMMDELRMVGFDFDRDGKHTPYPNAPDETMEYVHDHAITIRANLDHQDADGGRETALETPQAHPNFGSICCPIVTTGNDEIITYALVSENASANTGTITLKADGSTIRDAYINDSGVIVGEETVAITGVDLTIDNPPYTLHRFVVNAAGDGTIATPVADGIRALNFEYLDAAGRDYYCTKVDPLAVDNCAVNNRVPYFTLLGADALPAGFTDPVGGRVARAMVRAVDVELIGMETGVTARWRDGGTDNSDSGDMASVNFKKFRLFSRITPPNLGKTGEPDLASRTPNAPTGVTICTGHCDAVRVEWDVPANSTTFIVELYDPSSPHDPPTPFLRQEVAGEEIYDSYPLRAWAAFSGIDAPAITWGSTLYAVVVAVNARGAESPPSLASDPATVQDLVRPEAPPRLAATGYDPENQYYPNTEVLTPVPEPNHPFFPRENKVILLWDPPQWTLDVTDQGAPESSWTTRSDESTVPALECDWVPYDSDGDTEWDIERTPLREVFGNQRYAIFRGLHSRFVPTQADYLTTVIGEIHPSSGRLFWEDRTAHLWSFEDGDWLRTKSAMPCCTTWYYRIRAVDHCWNGYDPAGHGSLHLSPFFPPLNPGDVPDSDDVSELAPEQVGRAIPGYSIPSSKPNMAREMRYHDLYDDGAKYVFTLRFRAPKTDTTLDGVGEPAPVDSAYREYMLVSHPTNPNYMPNLDGSPGGEGQLDARIIVTDLHAEAIDRDDENGDGTIQDWEDETFHGTPGSTDLRIRINNDSVRWYRLIPVQCTQDTIAGEENDYYAYDLGLASNAIQIPCVFGGDDLPGYATIDTSLWPEYVTVHAHMYDETIRATHARLEISLPTSGESIISDDPGIEPTSLGSNTFLFQTEHIMALSRKVPPGSPVWVSAEVRDSNGCYTFTNKVMEDIELPACCLRIGSPVAVLSDAGYWATLQINEKCLADPLVIHTIAWALGNENGGRLEYPKKLYWGTEPISRGGSAVDSDYLGDDAIVLGPYEGGELGFQFNKDATMDSLSVEIFYTVEGQEGSCVFTEEILD